MTKSIVKIQKFKEDEQVILGVVLEPTDTENPDLHNDVYSAEEVKKACENFNLYCNSTNVEHLLQLPDGSADILKSFIIPITCVVGDQLVKEGSWLQEWKIHDQVLWKMVKDEEFTGFSIGGQGHVEDI